MTPTEFRIQYEGWQKTNPANDSDILPSPARHSALPRHSALAKELKPLLAWRDYCGSLEPVATNWMMADNDNTTDMDDERQTTVPQSVDCEIEIRPSVDELVVSATTGVEFETRADGTKIPLPGPNVDYGPEYPARPPLTGKVRAIARLGSVRLCTEDSKDGGPTRGSVISWSPAERYRGPKGPQRAWGPPPPDEAPSPEEICLRREQASILRSALSQNDLVALDTAMRAKNFADIGRALGADRKTAERRGKLKLIEACKNLSVLTKQLAA